MPRYRTLPPGPGSLILEGDNQFTRMNQKFSRDKLAEGEYWLAENMRASRNELVTRGGAITPAFANIVDFDEILGSAVYSNPNGAEVILIATPTQVLMLRSGAYPTTVPLPAGLTLSGSIEFSQQFSFILLHGGEDQKTLAWDGISDAGFEPVTKSSPENTARDLIPNVDWSVNLGGRAIFPYKIDNNVVLDSIAVTDIGDFSMFDPIYGVFRVNAGTSDSIVGVYPFANNNLIVAKRKSIDLVTNFVGNITDPASPDFLGDAMQVLSSTIGVAARKSAKMVGADLFFLSDTGVYRISEIVQDRLAAGEVPVSDLIAPIIRRINYSAADGAVAAVLGVYYFLAVPLDGSTYNNAVLVYNTVTQGWESIDTWAAGAGMRIDNLLVADYLGTPHVWAINHGANSVHVLYLDTATSDTTSEGEFDIMSIFETRGYASLGENGATEKDWKRAGLGLSTLRPSIEVTAIYDGAMNERSLTASAITKDRTKYYGFGKAPFDVTNGNSDFDDPGREDYTLLADDNFYCDESAPVAADMKQNKPEKFSLKGRGRWLALRVENTQGLCDVTGVIVESQGVGEIRRAA